MSQNSLDDFIPIVGILTAGADIIEQILLRAKSEYHTQPIVPDLICELKTSDDDLSKVEYIGSTDVYMYAQKPYFVRTIFRDMEFASKHFKKLIRITYERDDLPELYHTHRIDLESKTIEECQQEFNDRMRQLLAQTTKFQIDKFIEFDNDILFLTWKDIFYGDFDKLIFKLAEFTGIRIAKFDSEDLLLWREETEERIFYSKQIFK